MADDHTEPLASSAGIDPAVLGALAHLYRGEVSRSTHWRTRLDNTTNWAVLTTGIALSATFSDTNASPLPLVLVGFLVTFFLVFEARRYRYYNTFRARAPAVGNRFLCARCSAVNLLTWAASGRRCCQMIIPNRTITSAFRARSAVACATIIHGYCRSRQSPITANWPSTPPQSSASTIWRFAPRSARFRGNWSSWPGWCSTAAG